MPVTESPEDIPEDAVDVTQDVVKLKDELHQLSQGKDVAVISMALGSLIGETLDDPDAIKDLLCTVSNIAATIFTATRLTPPEGTTIQ